MFFDCCFGVLLFIICWYLVSHCLLCFFAFFMPNLLFRLYIKKGMRNNLRHTFFKNFIFRFMILIVRLCCPSAYLLLQRHHIRLQTIQLLRPAYLQAGPSAYLPVSYTHLTLPT